ncbi:hypothetical protein BS17DRAFT_775663 [Gyrodon lividus]|nr:hypothetical protein BS17DRAFT_775663 [Gyrodon lividus]
MPHNAAQSHTMSSTTPSAQDVTQMLQWSVASQAPMGSYGGAPLTYSGEGQDRLPVIPMQEINWPYMSGDWQLAPGTSGHGGSLPSITQARSIPDYNYYGRGLSHTMQMPNFVIPAASWETTLGLNCLEDSDNVNVFENKREDVGPSRSHEDSK